MNETYNGWQNYQTWNVALYIQNEYSFYQIAKTCNSYAEWLGKSAGIRKGATPDGVWWSDPRICWLEMNAMFKELKNV